MARQRQQQRNRQEQPSGRPIEYADNEGNVAPDVRGRLELLGKNVLAMLASIDSEVNGGPGEPDEELPEDGEPVPAAE